MKILADTHILIWMITADKTLPEEARELLEDEHNVVYYSTASIWEIEIKSMIRPEEMLMTGMELADFCEQAGYHELPLRKEHVRMLHTLHREEDAPVHKDPFDRIMIAQTKAEGMVFVTHDSLMPYYHENCIRMV